MSEPVKPGTGDCIDPVQTEPMQPGNEDKVQQAELLKQMAALRVASKETQKELAEKDVEIKQLKECGNKSKEDEKTMVSVTAASGAETALFSMDALKLDLGEDLDGYFEDQFTQHTGTYRTGDCDFNFCFKGEAPDFTACSSECGYCGRCGY